MGTRVEAISRLHDTEPINTALRAHAEETDDWSLNSKAQFLYAWADRFNRAFFGGQLPAVALSFRPTRHRELGHYHRGRNEVGVVHNINLNERHLYRSDRDLLATLLHEQIHQWQEVTGDKRGRRNYHNEAFRAKAEALGIPCDQRGVTIGYGDAFLDLLRKHGVQVDGLPATTATTSPKPGSKLRKWACGCGFAVRVAVATFDATCNVCKEGFELKG